MVREKMSNIIKTIKKELAGWKAAEIIWLVFASAVILGLSLYWGDSVIGIAAALTGIWCVIFTGKGKRSSFVFGFINVLCYAYIALIERFYGEVMLNMLYYVPMSFVGWFAWSKHMDDETGEVSKTKMSLKTSIVTYAVTLISIFVYGYILKLMGGKMPYVDSMSTVVAVVAQVLSVKRLTEQWVLWIVVDVVSVIMWGINFVNGNEHISVVAMWAIYLINAVVMYLKWHKEAK